MDEVLPSSDKALAEQMDAAVDVKTRSEAFGEWYYGSSGEARLRKYVARLAGTHAEDLIVEDIVGEAVVKAFEQVLKGHFQYQDCGFTAYVKTIAYHVFISDCRRTKTTELLPQEDEYKSGRANTDASPIEQTLIRQEELSRLLQPLTERRQRVLVLRFLQELDYADIASLLDISPGLARQEKSRAIRQLREILGTQ